MPKTAERAPAGVPGEMPPRVRHRLVAMTGALATLTLVHDLDHIRQARGLPFGLYGVAVWLW